MQIRSIEQAPVEGKRVFLRVDYDVPLKDGVVRDDSRIRATLPTIALLREHRVATIVLATHVGRPNGTVVPDLSTKPIFKHLQGLIDTTNIEMLENLRFNPGEEANDPAFARILAAQADIFVNDAFAALHRSHASIVGITNFLPAYAGLLVEKEIANLSQALTPPTPSLAIIGGNKFETKLPLIDKLSRIYSKVLVGGALANELLQKPASNVLLPEDGVPQFKEMFDIGPRTKDAWVREIQHASFVLWDGPVGWYEKGYAEGTHALAQALVDFGIRAVIGGGDTAAALATFSFDLQKIFISTGGGAALEFLVAGTLPGIEVLKEKE